MDRGLAVRDGQLGWPGLPLAPGLCLLSVPDSDRGLPALAEISPCLMAASPGTASPGIRLAVAQAAAGDSGQAAPCPGPQRLDRLGRWGHIVRQWPHRPLGR